MITAISLYVLIISSLFIGLAKVFDKNPPPIFGVYQRPGGLYWLKVGFMFVILWLRKIRTSLNPVSQEVINSIDAAQKLASNIKAADAVFFNGANKHGDHFVLGTARRKNRVVDGILFLKIYNSDVGVLQLPKAPDTALFNSGDENSYEAEGIKIISVEPMKKWKITYEGPLREFGKNGKIHNVKIDGIWTSDEPWFNYDTDMDPLAMAKAMAYEKWSRTYFKNLEANHQTHYEQFGILEAKISIDDKKYNIELDTLRDHSVAEQRDWAQFRRYGLHFLTSENGDHFSVGSLCMPISFSRLIIGYVYNAQEKKMYAVTNNNLDLFKFGELGNPPNDYSFSFTAGKTDYVIKVNAVDAPYFYLSKNWEAKFFESLCTFEVNGLKAWGTAEFQYRNINGKNILED